MFTVLSPKILPIALAVTLPLSIYQVSQARDSNQQTVKINFAGKVGEQTFACGESYSDIGTSATTVTLTDFRFYVSDLALIDASGNAIPIELKQDGKWQNQNVALIDFEDKSGACTNGTTETRTQIIATVKPGNYQGLQFNLGIPVELNHEDATLASSPLNLTSLWWSWQFGYKFLRVDFLSQANALKEKESNYQSHRVNSSDNKTQSFPIHIGSTGCQAPTDSLPTSGCKNPNRSTIILKNFNPENNVVVADLANLLAKTDLSTNQPDTPMGCMSSPEDSDCKAIMHNLGLKFDNQSSPQQSFFRVE